jgi:CheY-like chemotaxis protein
MTIQDPIVLNVDDSENDALLMRVVFERAGFVRQLRFARDGDEAIAYLQGDGIYSDRAQHPLPTVMLLDLNMPRKNGFEVLAWIRQQPRFRRLRVFILTASSHAGDIRRAYDLGAHSYLVKPGNLDGLIHLAKTLIAWLRLCHFAPLGELDDEPMPRLPSAPETNNVNHEHASNLIRS